MNAAKTPGLGRCPSEKKLTGNENDSTEAHTIPVATVVSKTLFTYLLGATTRTHAHSKRPSGATMEILLKFFTTYVWKITRLANEHKLAHACFLTQGKYILMYI